MTKVILWILLTNISIIDSARAASDIQYSFKAIWKLVHEKSHEISAANHDLDSARIDEKRTSRHWYPRVFAEGRVFSTNDPAQTFMSLLGQRQITGSDFAPQTLNQPGSSFFEQGSVGFDFPVFEGGAKISAARASAKMAESKSYELKSTEIRQYSELASLYSSLLSLQKQQRELQKLDSSVEDIISHYKIGIKSNPVGYSGLLGLKNLRHRLEGLLIENSAKTRSILDQVRVMAKDLPENWAPEAEKPVQFILTFLNPKNQPTSSNLSPTSVRAMHLVAESLENAKEAEKARFLPKVGLFGTENIYGGNRGSATSYTAGAYLQWDLFSATNFGAEAQAEHSAAAAQARAEGMRDRAQIERTTARRTAEALGQSLSLMEESANLLEEQTLTSKSLFKSGSINALQLVEVLARRADLLVNRTESEIALSKAHSTLFVNSSLEGVPNDK